MVVTERGLGFWTIANRFHRHRSNPTMKPVALREMTRLLSSSSSQAVTKRAARFITQYMDRPTGPRTA